ncbi:MAG: hypothetical protein U5L09_19890 [Bacteroidales bacterium]|nr:hypothetical protein [Bacteroidales bacterium]
MLDQKWVKVDRLWCACYALFHKPAVHHSSPQESMDKPEQSFVSYSFA